MYFCVDFYIYFIQPNDPPRFKDEKLGDEIFFLSTDSLILKLSASMEYLINAPDSEDTPDE